MGYRNGRNQGQALKTDGAWIQTAMSTTLASPSPFPPPKMERDTVEEIPGEGAATRNVETPFRRLLSAKCPPSTLWSLALTSHFCWRLLHLGIMMWCLIAMAGLAFGLDDSLSEQDDATGLPFRFPEGDALRTGRRGICFFSSCRLPA